MCMCPSVRLSLLWEREGLGKASKLVVRRTSDEHEDEAAEL